jgi:hypothetical protein
MVEVGDDFDVVGIGGADDDGFALGVGHWWSKYITGGRRGEEGERREWREA